MAKAIALYSTYYRNYQFQISQSETGKLFFRKQFLRMYGEHWTEWKPFFDKEVKLEERKINGVTVITQKNIIYTRIRLPKRTPLVLPE